MNQRESFEPTSAKKLDWRALLAAEGPAIAGINVLQGTVHILLFIVYVALIFSP